MSTEKVTYLLELRDKFSKNLAKANNGINRIDDNAKSSSLSLGKMRGALVALGIDAVAKNIFQAGVDMEQTRVTFATFLGDVKKGNKVISELNEFSNITPFNNTEVIKSGRVLLAANVPAEKLTKILKNVGDVASGAKVPLTELSAIYSKIANKGKAQAEELNQLAERGIPILDVLAKKFNTTAAGVLEMGSKGKLSSAIMAEAFETMTSDGGMFFNMMEKQSATTGGKLSTLQGSLGLLAAELGENMNPSITGLIDKTIALTNYLKENKDTVITVVKWIGRGAAAFVAYKATVFAVSKAQILLNTITRTNIILQKASAIGLKKTKVAMILLNRAMKANPIGLIVSALVIAIPLMIKLFSNTNKISAAQKALNKVGTEAAAIYSKSATKVRLLQESLKRGNITQKKRGDIIKEINKNYGSYLDKLLTEKSTDEDIAAALAKVNDQLLIKARLQAIEERITAEVGKQLDIEENLRNQSALREKATEGFLNKVEQLVGTIHFQGDETKQRQITKEIHEQVKAYQESKKIVESLTKQQLLASKKSILGKTGGGGGKTGPGIDLTKNATKAIETGIRSGAPKIININIKNLVETFYVETKQMSDAPIRVKEEMTKVFLDLMNDAALMQ